MDLPLDFDSLWNVAIFLWFVFSLVSRVAKRARHRRGQEPEADTIDPEVQVERRAEQARRREEARRRLEEMLARMDEKEGTSVAETASSDPSMKPDLLGQGGSMEAAPPLVAVDEGRGKSAHDSGEFQALTEKVYGAKSESPYVSVNDGAFAKTGQLSVEQKLSSLRDRDGLALQLKDAVVLNALLETPAISKSRYFGTRRSNDLDFSSQF